MPPFPRYPTSRTARLRIVKADMARELVPSLNSLEAGSVHVFDTADELRHLDTTTYTTMSQPAYLVGVGMLQFDPSSVAVDDGVNVFRPVIGTSSTGPGRWVRPTPSAQTLGAGSPGTWGYALVDHVHPMAGGAAVLVLTTAQRIALGIPAPGTLVYDTDLMRLFVWQADIDWPVWLEV